MKIVLEKGAYKPYKAHPEDAGFDLMAREYKIVPAQGSAIFDTGVHIEIPQGFVGFLKSKSGLNVKRGITSEGVIDAGYTGSICVKLYNNTQIPYIVEKGDKISQLVILPICSDELEDVEFSEKYQGVQEYTEMLIVCKEALEKQIPKKPYFGEALGFKGFFGYLCPICRNWLLYPDEIPNSRDSFCSFCGQKIDWTEVAE